MSLDNQIGIIEFGDVSIKCLIYKVDDNTTEILSSSEIPSEGIKNDIVVNLKKASSAIRSCISTAEKKANISLKKINLVFEQPDFLCTTFSKQKKMNGSKIHKEDIEFLLNEAKKQLIHNDKNQSIIHIFNHNYIVDNKAFVEEPINVYADLLTHETTFISFPKNNLKNINQIFIDCDIEIERFISRTFALGAQLLNNEELKSNSILIDLGLNKISMGLFKNFALVHSITFPFGIGFITKDISKVCSLDLSESNNIKNNFDFSFKNNPILFDEDNYLKKDFFIKSGYRKISKDLITNIIKARLDEIIDKLKEQLVVPGFSLSSNINFLLYGDGLSFSNIDKYFTNFFGPKIISPERNQIKKEKDSNNAFIPCLGALKIIKDGWETEAIPKIGGKNKENIGFFAKIFGTKS